MAPTAPKKRPSIRSKTQKSGSGLISRLTPAHREGAVVSDSFISSKKDKRTIKHSAFVNRIEKAHKKPLKRRRPGKKLVTTLEGLADSLPEIEEQSRASKEGQKIKMDSLTNGPGLMKRRGKVEKVERERFSKNMAQLMGAQNPAGGSMAETEAANEQPSATASRFAALRAWIGQTMEKEKAFEEK